MAARILSNYIRILKENRPKLFIHLVGHSLGAQIMGQVGFILKSEHDISVDRIDGLGLGYMYLNVPIIKNGSLFR